MLDLIGHLGYALMLGGNVLIARKNIWGWILHLMGDLIWIFIGIKIGMTSIWFWSAIFLTTGLYGYYNWRKDETTVSQSEG